MPQWPLPPGKPQIYPSAPGGLTAPTLADWQFQFGGVTMGAGTAIGISHVSGLGALPTINSQDQPFPRDTGEYVGVDAMGGRDPALDLVLTSDIFTQMASLGGALAAGGVTEQPLWFQLPGLPTLCSMCRPRDRQSDWDTNVSAAGMWTPSLNFHATDPRLYAQGQSVSSASAGTSSEFVTVTNSGNTEVRPVLVLSGPLSAPSITNDAAGSNVEIAFATGTSIASGDQVVIDCSTPHTVIYHTGGIAGTGAVYNVYNWIDQSLTSWWTLLPGTNTLVFTTGGASLAADQLEVWWANAYML